MVGSRHRDNSANHCNYTKFSVKAEPMVGKGHIRRAAFVGRQGSQVARDEGRSARVTSQLGHYRPIGLKSRSGA